MPIIYGWTPSSETADEDDSEHFCSVDAASPRSSSSYEDSDTLPTHETPARRGDPNWVARPRNAFIIFRCAFSRDNARGSGKRGVHVDTMSKRAGNAWNSLSNAEKSHYEILAKHEKAQHALAHPEYKYRPRKRHGSSKRYHRGRKPVPSDSKSVDSRSESYEDRLNDPPSPPASSPVQISPRSVNRRSSSVPIQPPLLLTPEERLGMRRTKSDMQDIRASMTAPALSPSLSSYELAYPYLDHGSPLVYGSPTPTSASFPVSAYPTPLASVSSLSNWDGGVTTALMDWTSSSSSSSTPSMHSSVPSWVSQSSDHNYHLTQASYAPEARPRGAEMFDSEPAIFWNPSQAVMGSMTTRRQLSSDNAALHGYNVGLANQVVSPEDYMLFDVPMDEQRLFEGFVHY